MASVDTLSSGHRREALREKSADVLIQSFLEGVMPHLC
jgi:hypothetical protein